jgi:ubiquitin C-terminal hydrolase
VNKAFVFVNPCYWNLVDKRPMVTKEAINNGSSGHTNNGLLLQLRFVNDQLPKTIESRFHSTTTVAQVAKFFDKEVSLPYGIDNLFLISYTIGNEEYRCPSDDLKRTLEETLEELKLENNSVLRFAYRRKQGSIFQSTPLVKSFQLRVKWPFRHRNMSFDYSDNTAVGELIDAIKKEFDIHAPTEEMELETSYGFIEIADLTKKLVPSSAIPIPIPAPTIFLWMKNDKITPQNVIIHSAMDGIVSNVVTTYQSSKTDHKICIKVHYLFSNHILILVMSSEETLYDLKTYIIDNYAGKGLEMKTIELGIIKPHRKLDLPDKASLADANIKTEMHLYADHIPNKSSSSKSNSLTEKRCETATTTSQTKSATTNEHQIKSASHAQPSSTKNKLPDKLDDSSVQLNTSNMVNQKSVNKSIVKINNLSVITSQAKTLSPTRTHPIGLFNTGNVCFMNSALQCLVHVPPLAHYFLNLYHINQSNTNHDENLKNSCDIYDETVGAFAYLMFQLWEGLNRPVDPNRMKTLVGRIAPRFTTNRQQDVQEFMTFLLDCLHCELKQNIDSKSVDRNETIIEQLFFGAIESCTICSVCQEKESTTNMISFLPLPLERQERFFTILYIPLSGSHQQHCIGAFSTDRLENVLNNFVKQSRFELQHRFSVSTFSSSNTYLDLDTPLNEIFDHRLIVREEKKGPFLTLLPVSQQLDSAPMTLMNCLEEFLACELLDGSWYCKNKCRKETESAARKMNLCTLPPVLIFQLKRFSEKKGQRCKLDKKVIFPLDELNLSKLLVGKCPTSPTPVYDLVAVSNHIGGTVGGHYTTYARQLIGGKWYHFDDTYVNEIQATEVVSKGAYLLVYIRRDV